MSRLKEVRYSCGCCGIIHYPRRASKNEAKKQIEAEIYYTAAEIMLDLHKDYYNDSEIEEEMRNFGEYTPDYLKNPCGVCGKDDDPGCIENC